MDCFRLRTRFSREMLRVLGLLLEPPLIHYCCLINLSVCWFGFFLLNPRNPHNLLRSVTVWVLGEQSVVGLFKADQGVSQNLALIASLTRAIASIKAELNPNK